METRTTIVESRSSMSVGQVAFFSSVTVSLTNIRIVLKGFFIDDR